MLKNARNSWSASRESKPTPLSQTVTRTTHEGRATSYQVTRMLDGLDDSEVQWVVDQVPGGVLDPLRRLACTLLHAMQDRDARLGVASLCIGGGQGIAMVVERP